MSMSEVALGEKASRLAARGQAWFYADDLDRVDAEHGTLVRVRSERGRDLGLGFYSDRSKLRLRLCGTWPGTEVPTPEQFFARRLRDAVARRENLFGPRAGVRLVHGEADGVPGLVVDRYADCLVVQATVAAIERRLDALVPALVDLLEPRAVVARHDVAARRFDDLPLEVRLLHGRRVEEVEIEEHGVVHRVALMTGHKTGFYLDQRPARALCRALADGRDVLDLFGYQGGFALAALSGGARSALCIDQSADALARATAAAQRNGLAGLETLAANAFDALRELRHGPRRFDLIVVDPPAFAKSRRELPGARRGYRDLNRAALRLLRPGGWLLTCTCSHHVTAPMFEDVLRQAAAGLPFRVLLRQRLSAGPDHPVWLSLPESEYLKVLLLQRTDLGDPIETHEPASPDQR
jgi:23S rRNA (cytosine1962-C5)-methyltransferase